MRKDFLWYARFMLSQKMVHKLADKKYRNETGLFLVEGKKNIFELLDSNFTIETIYGVVDFIGAVEEVLAQKGKAHTPELVAVTEEVLVKMGTLRTNNAGIAVVFQRPESDLDEFLRAAQREIVLLLDDVRDPGNLGTIIRTADWFGVTHIVASPTTTDFYNPKTIAATMGSFARIDVRYTELSLFLTMAHEAHLPIVGTSLNGKNMYDVKLKKNGVLIMGSESHGMSDNLQQYMSDVVVIPRYGKAESLNVSVATAVLLAELRRS